MPFDDSDITNLLEETGEDAVVTLSGARVKTIRVKYRADFETVSPYGDGGVGTYSPSFLCNPADLAAIASDHVFVIRGVEYVISGPPLELTSGLTRVMLAKH